MAQIKTGETYQSNVCINFFSSMKLLSEEQFIVSIFFCIPLFIGQNPVDFVLVVCFSFFHGAVAGKSRDWPISS